MITADISNSDNSLDLLADEIIELIGSFSNLHDLVKLRLTSQRIRNILIDQFVIFMGNFIADIYPTNIILTKNNIAFKRFQIIMNQQKEIVYFEDRSEIYPTLQDSDNFKALKEIHSIPYEQITIYDIRRADDLLNEINITLLNQQYDCKEDYIHYFRHLTRLIITDNPVIITIDCANLQLRIIKLIRVDNLVCFDCNSNLIENITGLETLTKLKILHLYKNQIDNLPQLSQLSNLRYLDCDKNILTTLPDLTMLKRLRTLRCSNNRLQSLASIENLTSLEIVNCSVNKLSYLFSNVKNATKIITLNCEQNQLNQEECIRLSSLKIKNLCLKNQKKGTYYIADDALFLKESTNPPILLSKKRGSNTENQMQIINKRPREM